MSQSYITQNIPDGYVKPIGDKISYNCLYKSKINKGEFITNMPQTLLKKANWDLDYELQYLLVKNLNLLLLIVINTDSDTSGYNTATIYAYSVIDYSLKWTATDIPGDLFEICQSKNLLCTVYKSTSSSKLAQSNIYLITSTGLTQKSSNSYDTVDKNFTYKKLAVSDDFMVFNIDKGDSVLIAINLSTNVLISKTFTYSEIKNIGRYFNIIHIGNNKFFFSAVKDYDDDDAVIGFYLISISSSAITLLSSIKGLSNNSMGSYSFWWLISAGNILTISNKSTSAGSYPLLKITIDNNNNISFAEISNATIPSNVFGGGSWLWNTHTFNYLDFPEIQYLTFLTDRTGCKLYPNGTTELFEVDTIVSKATWSDVGCINPNFLSVYAGTDDHYQFFFLYGKPTNTYYKGAENPIISITDTTYPEVGYAIQAN